MLCCFLVIGINEESKVIVDSIDKLEDEGFRVTFCGEIETEGYNETTDSNEVLNRIECKITDNGAELSYESTAKEYSPRQL